MGRTDTRIARYPRQRPAPGTVGEGVAAAGAWQRCRRRRAMQGDAALRTYLNDIDHYPLLTAEQERSLGERARNGDKAARSQLITSNLRLVVAIARTYSAREMTLLDLIGEGNIGLVAAVDRYHPDKGARFASYAGWWIRQAISRAVAEKDSALPLPQYLFLLQARVQRAIDTSLAERGRGLTLAELCREARVTVKQLRLLAQAPAAIVSLDAPARTWRDDGPTAETLAATLPASDEADGGLAAALAAAEADSERARVLALLKAHLTQREYMVLALRLQLVAMPPGHEGDDAPTLLNVGHLLKLTRERVRQIEVGALAKLRRIATVNDDGSLRLPPPAPSLVAAGGREKQRQRPRGGRYVQPALFGAA